jgi:hypothetical protein
MLVHSEHPSFRYWLDNALPQIIPLLQYWINFSLPYELTDYSDYSGISIFDAVLANSKHLSFEYLSSFWYFLDNASPQTIPWLQYWINFGPPHELTDYSDYSGTSILDAMLANSKHLSFEYLLSFWYLLDNASPQTIPSLQYWINFSLPYEPTDYSDYSGISILNIMLAHSKHLSFE